MALQAAYKQFLEAPNPSLLAQDASLHYVTTLTSLHDSAAIIKFLATQGNQLKKKEEKFLDVVESQNAIAAEIHTTIEFESSGSAYLPGLDDNFLADRTVTFPIIHFVQFNANGKIQQIRQSWDQGSLLKLIDVIGKTGRNWPIRDGKDQIKLISSSVAAGGKPVESAHKQELPSRSRDNSTHVTRDPHASLSLFAPREQALESSLPAVVAPRASARPPPRDMSELFVGESNGAAPATPARGRSTTSTSSTHSGDVKEHQQNYLPSRLFDNDENSPIRPGEDTSKEARYRPNPAKFKHFDFADAPEAPDAAEARPTATSKKSKHGSQWAFEDFQTPAKVVPSKVLANRTNDVRHWGNSDDEVLDSPVKMKKVDKPRKDAETHFEFRDDGTPKGEPRLIGRPRGAGQNNGSGLYQNNLYDEETGGGAKSSTPKVDRPANVKDRRKDFDPHFSMSEDSPSTKNAPAPLGEDRAKAVKMMDSNWDSYDQSPSQKENIPTSSTSSHPSTSNGKGPLSETTNTKSNKGINIAGDGMGSRKVASAEQSPPKQKGINIGGDGMGGKKGSDRGWMFGNDDGAEEAANLNRKTNPGKAQHPQKSGGDFWDF